MAALFKPVAGDHVELKGLHTFYKPADIPAIEKEIDTFLSSFGMNAGEVDLLITGRNGDPENDLVYDELEASLFLNKPVVHYKHLCGEYPTSVSFALWLAVQYIKREKVVATTNAEQKGRTVLIYNHYQHKQHSLMLVATSS